MITLKTGWKVAQQGVQSFVAHALTRHASFGMETVFSHWRDLGGGKFESKIDLIEQLRSAGYFVLLIFVGRSNPPLFIASAATRAAHGGHTVSTSRLLSRFPKTQTATCLATSVADTTIMVDNIREPQQAFTLCRVSIKADEIYNRRYHAARLRHQSWNGWIALLHDISSTMQPFIQARANK